ncbi:MAG: chromosome segregation protein SMC [Deltaproteobacteria bacterium]|nr:chromosome segregation protein SMC [Deltaproteobacteria bacterium]
MIIDKIELSGFKSFAEKTLLQFHKGITAIVGPNGCGKSNIVDAVLWCIGARNARNLRARVMEDVIFSGSEEKRPLSMAEVTLFFLNDGKLFPTNLKEVEEFSVTRRLYRSGESEFLINNSPCRLKDIAELFMGTGLGEGGYGIIEQDKVNWLISAHPRERRTLIEEAAGITKFKEKKRVTLIKLENTRSNLLRLEDLIFEITRRANSLKRQASKAKRFIKVREKIKELELSLAQNQLLFLFKKLKTNEKDLDIKSNAYATFASTLSQKDALILKLKDTLTRNEEELSLIQSHYYEIKNLISLAESKKKNLLNEQNRMAIFLKNQASELEELSSHHKELKKELKKYEEESQEVESEYNRYKKELIEKNSLVDDLKKKVSQIEKEQEKRKEELLSIISNLAEIHNKRVSIEKEITKNKAGISHIIAEKNKILAEIEKIENLLKEKKNKKQKNKIELISIEERREKAKEKRIKIKEKIENLVSKIKREELKYHQIISQSNSLKEMIESYEGMDQGIKNVLIKHKKSQNKDGIFGLVADMVEVTPGYEIALESALGKQLQYILVKDRDVGVKEILYLKQTKGGRGTFIPAEESNLLTTSSPLTASNEPGIIGPLSDFVKIKKEFSKTLKPFIDGIYIVDDISTGLSLWNKNGFRFLVTKDGDLIDPNGVVAGGSEDSFALSRMKRKRELKELEEKSSLVKNQLNELYFSHEQLLKETNELEKEEAILLEEFQRKNLEITKDKMDISQLIKSNEKNKEQINILSKEINRLRNEEKLIEKERERLEAVEKEKNILKIKKEDELAFYQKEFSLNKKILEEKLNELTSCQVNVASLEEKRNRYQENIKRLKDSLIQTEEKQRKIEKMIAKGKDDLEKTKEEFESTTNEIRKLIQENHLIEEKFHKIKEDKEKLSLEIQTLEKEASNLKKDVDNIQKEMIEKKMAISEIKLEISHLIEQMEDRYHVKIKPLEEDKAFSEKEKEELHQKLITLKTKLEKMGEVNLLAVEEYQELSKRLEFLNKEKYDLENAMDHLLKAIKKIEQTTSQRFVETYKKVRESFKELFSRLFDGGKADIILSDENDPLNSGIEIIAQPPGKKLQNINLLSGGEKALIAISLIVSLFIIKKGSLCIMDEIDAPLDDLNITRFTQLLKELSNMTQIILITHNKRTMEVADILHGITMEKSGISKLVSVKLS